MVNRKDKPDVIIPDPHQRRAPTIAHSTFRDT